MEFNFTIDGTLDPVATYAALLSTLIAFWEVLKWRARNAIAFKCFPNMEMVPSIDKKTYIVADFTNKGDTQTIVTNLGLYYWERWYHRFLRKKWKNFIVKEDSIPFTVQPGAIWKGMIVQNDELEQMARNGYLYVVVFHSMSQKGVMKRIKLSTKTKTSDQKLNR